MEYRRNLTPLGRTTVFKSLVFSQLNHLFLVLPNPNESVINELRKLMFSFIWNSPIDKIKREVAVQNYDQGGLKILDLNAFINALKSTWIRRYYMGTGKWKLLLSVSVNFDLLTNCGPNYIKNSISKLNDFWKHVFNAWNRIIEINSTKKVDSCPLGLPIWYNSQILIDSNPIFYRSWYEKGIFRIGDFIKESSVYYTFEEFTEKYNIETNFLTYHGILNCLKKYINSFPNMPTKIHYPTFPKNIAIFYQSKKGTKDIYSILSENNIVPTGVIRWNMALNLHEDEWKFIFINPFLITKYTTLQWFQFRINHRILGTNLLLHKIDNNTDYKCTFCKREPETIEHLLWECELVKKLLNDFDIFTTANNIPFTYNKITFLFGLYSENKHFRVDSYIILCIKYYIYKTRCQNKTLSLCALKQYLKSAYETRKHLSITKGTYTIFSLQWQIWKQIFEV